MIAAVAVTLWQTHNIPLLMALALVFGIADAARMPAAGALPRWLLAPADLAKGQGLVATVGRVSSMLAGPAAGFALATGGATAAMLVNLALFTAALALFFTLRGLP